MHNRAFIWEDPTRSQQPGRFRVWSRRQGISSAATNPMQRVLFKYFDSIGIAFQLVS